VSPSIVLIAVFAYIALLFGLARLGDRQQFVEHGWAKQPLVYALALGVYCTSWTLYGLVGTASVSGWKYLPILLGPTLLFTLGYPILHRILTICRQEHLHSIADFIASRYGKRQGLAATVTLLIMIATIPYIALQLKAVSDTLLITVDTRFLVNQDLTLVTALCMIAFALLFGANRLDISGYHSGLMTAIAFESLVKLVVLMFVGCLALVWFVEIDFKQTNAAASAMFSEAPSLWRFLTELLLSACAIFCLPRMFHVTFVECLSFKHLQMSRWVFPIYLVMIALCILVIAWVGNLLFFNDSQVTGDMYLIALPLAKDMPWLALIAFIGGFSAATAMTIVATITMSQMLSNDVILPILLKRKGGQAIFNDFSTSLIFARRLTVILIVVLAYLYQVVLAEHEALTSIGLIAFALVVQLSPAILFGLYWRRGNANGVYAGLIAGLSLWFYTLMLPLLVDAGLMDGHILVEGLFGFTWLRPEFLFGFSFADEFTRGVLISLSANIFLFLWYSMSSTEALSDRIQAIAFTSMEKSAQYNYDDIELKDLRALLSQFVGKAAVEAIYANSHKQTKQDLIAQTQQALSGVVGIASSQAMIESLRSGEKLAVEEVVTIFEETTRALRFNQDILSASFENISSAISVVDENLMMIAWNKRYETMFNYPEGMLRIGLHVSDLVRFNARRGLLGPGDIEEHVRKRLSKMALGESYRVVRDHQDEPIIEIKGMPLPNGGYVTTYDDITEFITAQNELERSNVYLEQRVKERTKTIENINRNLRQEIERRKLVEEQLIAAKLDADEANASKTRFLALASHDILQPLNAANLYVSSLLDVGKDNRRDLSTLDQIKSAIHSTESIISTLLEVSKLDTGAMLPSIEAFDLNTLLNGLVNESRVQLGDSVSMSYVTTSVAVLSDKHYLRRILQNFISNAIKYTEKGKILIGCRYRGKKIEICVYDTGVGISKVDQQRIFDDFYRVSGSQKVAGVGLGLAVAARFSDLLGYRIRCRSDVGQGSCFSISLPRAEKIDIAPPKAPSEVDQDDLVGLRVFYVDDQMQNLQATQQLLERWQCHVSIADSAGSAFTLAANSAAPDVLLMDYNLDNDNTTGIELATKMSQCWKHKVPVCIVSAGVEVGLPAKVADAGFEFLRKPVKPGRLRALLAQFKQRQYRK